MTCRFRFLAIAVAAIGSVAFAGISADPASAYTGGFKTSFTGYGATQAAAQQDADNQLAAYDPGGMCFQHGPDNYSATSTGWKDVIYVDCVNYY